VPRAFLVVMDGVGIGGAPDAAAFYNDGVPDTGANTLGHIAEACAAGRGEEGRTGPLHLPHMCGLGLAEALALASDRRDLSFSAKVRGAWGAATETSRGKDTPTGHWELAGVPVPWEWHTFPDQKPAFPEEVTRALCEAAGTDGILANCHASGTEIIEREGAEHLRSGWPICYTSADSVFQIAAHEEHFGLDRLLKLCADVAPLLHDMKVGRVIARPFVGDAEAGFTRTQNRKDYAIAPPAPTLLEQVQTAGRHVQAIGKIGDIFSMRGIDAVSKGSDTQLMVDLHDAVETAPEGGLVFANFVEFDSLYGHRRDLSGYARHLEWFDGEIGRVLERLREGDLLIITADHGNDPTWVGTDHTRERVPVIAAGIGARELGQMGFADVAATVAAHLDVAYSGEGRSRL